jgi:hypothetical protein
MNEYLNMAKSRMKILNKLSEGEMYLPISEFIPCIFYKCNPNMYGIMFAKKVILESNGFLTETSQSEDNGDCSFNHSETGLKTHGEFKISFRNKSGNYRLTNIRTHQGFEYFIICFVDTHDNFKPKFYVVPKEHVTSKGFLTLTAMNGTSDANLYNKVVPMSTNIKYDDADWYFSRGNILSGTTYKHLMNFLKTKKVKSISNK